MDGCSLDGLFYPIFNHLIMLSRYVTSCLQLSLSQDLSLSGSLSQGLSLRVSLSGSLSQGLSLRVSLSGSLSLSLSLSLSVPPFAAKSMLARS